MREKMVGNVPSSVLGTMEDIFCKLRKGAITFDELKKFAKRENPFVDLDYFTILADYEEYFKKIHGLKTDFAGIRIPEADDTDFPWFVCRPENFFAERAYSGGKKLYPKWKWTNKSLDDVLDLSFGRDGNVEPHITRFRANWEADEDLANLSANQISKKDIDTACLTERLILGDFLFWKFKRHLDIDNITLCAGSRYSDDLAPNVDWYDDELRVLWDSPDDRFDYLRARRVS